MGQDTFALPFAMSTWPQQRLWDACKQGDLATAQDEVHSGVDIHAHYEHAFRLACGNGHLQIAQWLVAQGGMDIHAGFDRAFRWACDNGHLEVGRWLVGLDPSYAVWPPAALAQLRSWGFDRAAWMRSVTKAL